jgi:hypothetical protein
MILVDAVFHFYVLNLDSYSCTEDLAKLFATAEQELDALRNKLYDKVCMYGSCRARAAHGGLRHNSRDVG